MQILLGIVLSLVASGLATALYAWLVWWLDRYEKEPWWLLATAFVWGALPAVALSAVAELILDIPLSVLGQGLAYEVAGSSLIAPVVEECAKGLIVLGIFFVTRREMDSVLDGIVYGAMAGLGFALTENFFYFLGSLQEGGWSTWAMVVFIRAVVFGLNHAFFTGITGAAVGFARLSVNALGRFVVPWLGLMGAVIFHSVHNFGSTLASVTCLSLLVSLVSDWGGLVMLALAIGLAWRQEKGWIRTQLASEVGTTLQREGYELAVSYSKRLTQTATELAFKKQQLASLGDEGGSQQVIERLRAQLAALQAQAMPQ
jgi:RsiW-degrading membrane proteinase PrsW (M82 family)